MKYEISQKMFVFGDDFSVRDETGRERYYIDGKAFTFGKQLLVLDSAKVERAAISQKLFAFNPTFHIKRDGQVSASIKKKRFTLREQFLIDVPGTNDYTVVGDFVGHEYSINRGGHEVARVSKHFFSMTDSYGVDIREGDPLLLICAVVVIDLVLHNQEK